MTALPDMLEPYAELERDVCRLMKETFSEICGLCTACCCRADICEEVTQSAFLSMLLDKQGMSSADMDDRFGWLDLQGCTLEYGRPPVCYSYFCDELLDHLPDEESRSVVLKLGRLMHHIGINALGERHLVEIASSDDLAEIDYDRLLQRLEDARAAFDVIAEYLESGRLAVSGRALLDCISAEEP